MKNQPGKQLQGTATVDRAIYKSQYSSFTQYARAESRDVFNPALPNEHEPIRGERKLLIRMIALAIREAICPPPAIKPVPVVSEQLAYMRNYTRELWRTEREQAEAWILQEHDQGGRRRFSLDWCCLMLGETAEVIRHRLRVTLGYVVDAMTPPFTMDELDTL